MPLQISETVEMARHYACSMDIHPSLQTLLVCGVAKVITVFKKSSLTSLAVLNFSALQQLFKSFRSFLGSSVSSCNIAGGSFRSSRISITTASLYS